jgi:transcriptional regulator with XRE-family HTH domain
VHAGHLEKAVKTIGGFMLTGSELRTRRLASGLSGALVCSRAGVVRSRLSEIERGYVKADAEQLNRIAKAIAELTTARGELGKMARAQGLAIGSMSVA